MPPLQESAKGDRGQSLCAAASSRRDDTPGLASIVCSLKNLRVCGGGGPAAGAARTALPPRADVRLGTERSTWLIPGRGIAVAGQRRIHTGLRRLCTGRGLCARRSEHSARGRRRQRAVGLTGHRSPVKVARSSPVGLPVCRTWRLRRSTPSFDPSPSLGISGGAAAGPLLSPAARTRGADANQSTVRHQKGATTSLSRIPCKSAISQGAQWGPRAPFCATRLGVAV